MSNTDTNESEEPTSPPVAPPVTFESAKWGTVKVLRGMYHNGTLAVHLTSRNPEDEYDDPLATLSVNFDHSVDLPANCFHVKDWSENAELAEEAMASGLFKRREDLPPFHSGFVVSEVWEFLK